MNKLINVEDRMPIIETLPLSFQHLFAMVGSTILVPILTKMNPSVALLCSGVGTLLYILCTKAKLPAYIGSSFAFIGPIVAVSTKYGGMDKTGSAAVGAVSGGVISAGVVYLIVALLIGIFGIGWLNKALSSIVVGSVVIVIGLGLATTAINWAGLNSSYSDPSLVSVPRWVWITVAMITLAVGIIGTMYFKGFLGVIPILIAMLVGYISALALGVVPRSVLHEIATAPFFRFPNVAIGRALPKFNLDIILLMAPVSFVTLAEHIGHVYVTNNVVGRDFTKEPGLHRSILGDGVATITAGLLGGPPNTTYGENIGVMAITRVYSVWVIGGAAVIAIILSFIGPVAVFIENMPLPVIGGVSILLFGIIASSGFRIFVDNKIDFGKKRNLLICSVIIVLGIGGAAINVPVAGNSIQISGVALATLVGIILNLILPEKSRNEE
jgi:uracil permease